MTDLTARGSNWGLEQNSSLQAELDRVTDAAIEKVIERKIQPEMAREGVPSERSKLKLSRASQDDQASIEALFETQPVRLSGMELLNDRAPDFFSLLRARGNASAALTARLGVSKDLWGLGSISVREGYFNQEEARVAYLGDLRMLLSRSTGGVWRQLYNQILQDVSSELGVAGFLTAIVGENKAALRSLVSRRNSEFVYEPLGSLRILGILGRWALLSNGRRRLDEQRIQFGVEAEAEFQRFYAHRAKTMRHGWREVPKAGVPIVLRNRNGETKIVARLVSPDPMKRFKIKSIDWKTRTLFQALRATGMPAFVEGASLTTTYLSWVCFGSSLTPVERRHALIELIDVCLEYEPLADMGIMKWMLLVPDSIGLSVRELGDVFTIRLQSNYLKYVPIPKPCNRTYGRKSFKTSVLKCL